MPSGRQHIKLPADLIRKIQQAYMDKTGSTYGALQKTVVRGAELALAELTGENEKVEEKDEIDKSTLAKSGIPLYNPENIAEVKQKILVAVEQLSSAIQTLDQVIAVGKTSQGGATTTTNPQDSALAREVTDSLEAHIKHGGRQIIKSTKEIDQSLKKSPASKRRDAG